MWLHLLVAITAVSAINSTRFQITEQHEPPLNCSIFVNKMDSYRKLECCPALKIRPFRLGACIQAHRQVQLQIHADHQASSPNPSSDELADNSESLDAPSPPPIIAVSMMDCLVNLTASTPLTARAMANSMAVRRASLDVLQCAYDNKAEWVRPIRKAYSFCFFKLERTNGAAAAHDQVHLPCNKRQFAMIYCVFEQLYGRCPADSWNLKKDTSCELWRNEQLECSNQLVPIVDLDHLLSTTIEPHIFAENDENLFELDK